MKNLFVFILLLCSTVAWGQEESTKKVMRQEADCSIADKYLNSKNYSKAIREYSKIIKSNSSNNCMEAYYGRALAYYNMQKWKKAIEDLIKTRNLSLEKNKSIYNHCTQLLETANAKRQEQLEYRAQVWSAVAMGVASSAANVASQMSNNAYRASNSYSPSVSSESSGTSYSGSGSSSSSSYSRSSSSNSSNTRKKCSFTSVSDKLHCGGDGKCSRCGGDGKMDGFGLNNVKCSTCGGTGKCPSCKGTGYLN